MTKIGTFNKAMVTLRKGLKVTRPCWKAKSYWYMGVDEIIFYSDNTKATVHLNQIQAKKPVKTKSQVIDSDELKGDLRESTHHAIPKCLKPKFNVKIPLHIKCHKKLHETFIPSNKLEKIKKLINEATE